MGSGLHMEAIDRITSIPLVESSVKRVEHIYDKVKNNNRLFSWYFETAEATISAAYDTVQPAVKLFELPIKRLDNMMCKSLDILEQRIPLVYLPPEMVSRAAVPYIRQCGMRSAYIGHHFVLKDVLEYQGVHVGSSGAARAQACGFSQTNWKCSARESSDNIRSGSY